MLLAALARHACVSCQRVSIRVFSLSQSCHVSYHRAYMCTHCRAWSRVLLSIGLFLYEGVVYRVVDAGAELVLCVWSCICGTGSVEFSC